MLLFSVAAERTTLLHVEPGTAPLESNRMAFDTGRMSQVGRQLPFPRTTRPDFHFSLALLPDHITYTHCEKVEADYRPPAITDCLLPPQVVCIVVAPLKSRDCVVLKRSPCRNPQPLIVKDAFYCAAVLGRFLCPIGCNELPLQLPVKCRDSYCPQLALARRGQVRSGCAATEAQFTRSRTTATLVCHIYPQKLV